jgi:hypothetical protein
MANGHHAVLPHELEPASATEVEIGEAAAAAAVAIGLAVADFAADGQLTEEAKMTGGGALVRVAQLQLTYFGGDAEFADIIRREGSRALWGHPGFKQHAADLPPMMRNHMFAEFLQGVIEIASKVVNDERALGQQ